MKIGAREIIMIVGLLGVIGGIIVGFPLGIVSFVIGLAILYYAWKVMK